jgi:hypothetical protein
MANFSRGKQIIGEKWDNSQVKGAGRAGRLSTITIPESNEGCLSLRGTQ